MVTKFIYGNPFKTDAVIAHIPVKQGHPNAGKTLVNESYTWTYEMRPDDIVYGLGEANRGINKRGFLYINDCKDLPEHTEDLKSLYCAHNFIVIAGQANIGLFFDYPSTITFDIGYTSQNFLSVHCDSTDLNVYFIEGESPYDIVKQFRKIIGRSYIPPRFAFGFGQSRLGYKKPEDFRAVVRGYRQNHIPLDLLYMDIDYMEEFKDFTVNTHNFPDFPAFVQEMKKEKIHLVPIIDAGIKIQPGYDVYEEGVQNNYFCKRADGTDFVAVVWPGETHFPDVLNADTRKWFGEKYRYFTDMGIDGFWNDMNEPAIFHTPEEMEEVNRFLKDYVNDTEHRFSSYHLFIKTGTLKNNPEDFKRFYHNVDGVPIRHDQVHNLFGYNMTRAASEAFDVLSPDKRILLFSRSSYIGMHRYGGIWTGDNKSWWSHLLLNIKMMPSLNMCGFLYAGADIGGFGSDTTRDLLLRWLAFGVFTPLMRNHSSIDTRLQECYNFENPEDFRTIISVRYRLLPYLYSEYMKAALNDDLFFKPLAFVYPEDTFATSVEDQLIIGNEIMITPVYIQNAPGRYVYLPENMLFIKFMKDGSIYMQELEAGHHYIYVNLNEVPLFIRAGHIIPVAGTAQTTDEIDTKNMELLGYSGARYTLYDDDGIHKHYDNPENIRILEKN